jgi:hypothetical protein
MSDREVKRAQKNKTKPAQEHDKDQIREWCDWHI